MADVVVTKDPETSRYEAAVDGRAAGFADYRTEGEVVVIPHTEVFDEFGGKGVGSAIAHFALDDVRAQGARVRPDCPFIAGWIDKHPDYQDLVA